MTSDQRLLGISIDDGKDTKGDIDHLMKTVPTIYIGTEKCRKS